MIIFRGIWDNLAHDCTRIIKLAMRRLNAFRAAGSGKAITPCSESLQKAKVLLSGPPADADVDLPTGASWSLQPLVCSFCAPLSADTRWQHDGHLQA